LGNPISETLGIFGCDMNKSARVNWRAKAEAKFFDEFLDRAQRLLRLYHYHGIVLNINKQLSHVPVFLYR